MSAESDQRVIYQIQDGVADVRLNRGDKLNALDPAMFQGLADTAHDLAERDDVRAVVLSGEGRGFCAGLDFSQFQGMANSERGQGTTSRLGSRVEGRITNLAQEAVYAWRTLKVPTIAAVHGVALGGGFQLALGPDIRIVAPDVRMSVLEIRWGLIPDMTGTWFLPRMVGLERAKELTWTGRMVGGQEAVSIGLALEVAEDPRARALELAGVIAGQSPDAIRIGKALLERTMDTDIHDQFLEESWRMGSLIGSPNQVEAVMAYFDKRPPQFDKDPVVDQPRPEQS